MQRIIKREENYCQKEVNLHESLFGNANGYIGVRGALEEGVPEGWGTMRGMYVNGVYEVIPMKQAESLCNLIEKKQTMVNAADTQTILLYVDGEEFSPGQGTLKENVRILNMDEGYTGRQVTWVSPGGREVRINIKRMAHFNTPGLFTIEYRVTPVNFSGELKLVSKHIPEVFNYSDPNDPRLADESPSYLKVKSMEISGDVSVSVSRTEVSGISVCAAVTHKYDAPGKAGHEYAVREGVGEYTLTAEAKENESVCLLKYTAFSDSIRNEDVTGAAEKVLGEASEKDIEELYGRQRDYLSDFWQGAEMEIKGDEETNLSVCFNMYMLLQSAPRDRFASIAAKGLSGEGYEGHYFWDTEMYVTPFFIMTNPSLARTVLSYRYNTLDKARENAALVGHKKGALYPWRTITGEECSGYFPSGTAAYHINGAVAYTIVYYYLATGDKDFILTQGAEVLLETARLWADVGNYDRAGRFMINEVTGPDEYTCMVNNNYYTNCCAKYNMLWAVKLLREYAGTEEIAELKERLKVTEEELSELSACADAMYLPYDEELGINPQDDSFLQKPLWDVEGTPKEEFPLLLHYHPLHLYRFQVCKQADTVFAHYLFPEEQPRDAMEKSFRYYEKITTHDSSLSTCVFSLQASRLGLEKEAGEYFGDSAKLDLMNTHNNTKDGVHTANMGGCYMAIVNGFAGVRITEEGLFFDPYVPEGWEGYSFNFRYMGRLLRLEADGNGSVLTLLEGEPEGIRINGQADLKFPVKIDHKK